MRSLWYTAYVVSSLTFLVMAYAEWQIPGFVSSVFPAYIVLIIAIVCGVGTLMRQSARPLAQPEATPAYLTEGWSGYMFAVITGILFAVVVVDAGTIFGAYRLVLALIAFVLPVLLLKALSDVKD